MTDSAYWSDSGYWANGWWGQLDPEGSVTGIVSIDLLEPTVSIEGSMSSSIGLELLEPVVSFAGDMTIDATIELSLSCIVIDLHAPIRTGMEIDFEIEL